MGARHVWGFWDCPYCDNKHIRGDNDCCPDCGHRRSADVKFYLDKNNIFEVSQDKKSDKANWICSFCGNQNSDNELSCLSCGASKNSANGDYFNHQDNEPIINLSIPTPTSRSSSVTPAKPPASVCVGKHAAKMGISFRKVAKIAIPILIAVAVIISIVAFVNWFNTPLQKEITINGVSWSRSIDIEELRTYNESGWALPNDARLQYTKSEIRSYNKVIDHYETKTRRTSSQSLVGYHEEVVGYEDLGNGQFKEKTQRVPEYTTVYSTETYQEPVYRDEPVYDTKYYYEIDRWCISRSVDTSGFDKSPFWGDVTLRNKERKASSHESYYISGIVDEKLQKYKLGYGDWQKYNIGDMLQLTVRRGDNKVLSIDGVTSSSFDDASAMP